MKLQAYKVPAFLTNPDPKIKVFLFYGPEFGMVSEYGAMLADKLMPQKDNPFAHHQLSQEALQSGELYLGELFSEISLFATQKLIHIRHATDRLTSYLKDALEGPVVHYCIIEAGDLPARSSLRKFCEASELVMTLPCYAEDYEALRRLIASILREKKFQIEREALDYAAIALASNRAMLRSELEKLMLYKGSVESSITLQDVEVILSSHREDGLEAPFIKVLEGNIREAQQMLANFSASGESSIALIRASLRYLHRLLLVRSALDGGKSMDEALRLLRPPLFFKEKPLFTKFVMRYPSSYLAKMQKALLELEMRSKQTGAKDRLFMANLFFQFARYNQRFYRQ